MPDIRIVRYTLRGNYWTSPGRVPIPAPPFDPSAPDPARVFKLNDPASRLNGTKVLG
jgi:hypothetical protein